MNNPVKYRIAGLSVAALAFVLYVSQWLGFAFPDQWSSALYSIMGLDPFRPLSKPLWQLIMAFLGQMTGASVLSAANLFSALMGSLSVWLVFHLGVRIRRRPKIIRTEEDVRRFDQARLVSGLVAALFLAVSAPMIVVSARLHPFSLDLSLLLGVTLLSVLYRDNPRRAYWFWFAALYGIGIAEFSTFILLGPLFICWWAWLFWQARQWSWASIAGGIGLSVLGASIGLLFCLQYAKSPVAEWREFDSLGEVIRYFLIDHYQQIRYSVPKHGWLIVLLTMVLPAGFILWNGVEEADDLFSNLGLYLFRIVLVAVALIILFNLPGSPWRVMGPSVTLVTPYAITALWFGQLCGFFHDRLSRPFGNRIRSSNRRTVSPWYARSLLAALILMFVAAAAANIPRATPRQAAPMVALSRDVLDGLGDAEFMLTNGSLDPVMKWIVYEEGTPVRLINRVQASSRAYMRFIATWFNNLELEGMAEVGMGPFLDVWITGDTNAYRSIAIQDVPEFWTLQGYAWQPGSGFYRGVPLDAPVEVNDNDLAACRNLLEKYRTSFGRHAPHTELMSGTLDQIARQLAVLANNLGYYLIEHGRLDEAVQVLAMAQEYNPDNISALMNLADAADRQGKSDEATAYRENARKKAALLGAALSPRRLVGEFGMVHNPAVMMQEGIALIRTGITDQGINRFVDALSLQQGNPSAEFALAKVLFDNGNIVESRQRFEELASDEPGNAVVRLYLARCQVIQGEIGKAEQSFSVLADLGMPQNQIDVERGFALLQAGRPGEALPLFEKGLEDDGVSGPSAVGTIWAASKLDRPQAAAKAANVLTKKPNYFAGQMVLYELAMARGDLLAARESLMYARRIQPGNADVLEKAIRLELLQGREPVAKELLDRLLEVDSSNPYGNYLLSSVHERNGRLDLAEVALRRALANDLTGEASYGLAWVLERQGRYDEALGEINKALRIQPKNPQFLAVQGIILGAQGQWGQAEALLNEAITIRGAGKVPLFDLQLAKVYLASGKSEKAKALLQELSARKESFSGDEAILYEKIVADAGLIAK